MFTSLLFLISVYIQPVYARLCQRAKRYDTSRGRERSSGRHFSWWPPGYRRGAAASASTVDHAGTSTSIRTTSRRGSEEPAIPLSEKPSHTSRIFGARKNNPHSTNEWTAARPDETDAVNIGTVRPTGGYGYGNSGYGYGNGSDTGTGWPRVGGGYAEYEYGQSGISPGGYDSHGYGRIRRHETEV